MSYDRPTHADVFRHAEEMPSDTLAPIKRAEILANTEIVNCVAQIGEEFAAYHNKLVTIVDGFLGRQSEPYEYEFIANLATNIILEKIEDGETKP